MTDSDSFELRFHLHSSDKVAATLKGVTLTDNVLDQVWQHALNHTIEIVGILIGNVKDGRVQVEGSIPACVGKGNSFAVTITHEDWDYFHRELSQKYPSYKIVGWYHSHPGHGIFLSTQDRFIHKSFFSELYQVALVVDPIQSRMGLFVWQDTKLVECLKIELPKIFKWTNMFKQAFKRL